MIKNVSKFLNEVKLELSKVVWPSRQELIGSTLISLVFIAIFTVYLGGLDFIFNLSLRNMFFIDFLKNIF